MKPWNLFTLHSPLFHNNAGGQSSCRNLEDYRRYVSKVSGSLQASLPPLLLPLCRMLLVRQCLLHPLHSLLTPQHLAWEGLQPQGHKALSLKAMHWLNRLQFNSLYWIICDVQYKGKKMLSLSTYIKVSKTESRFGLAINLLDTKCYIFYWRKVIYKLTIYKG